MSTKKHLAKIIGLAVVAALAIAAFASASASAATWTVEGAKLSGEGTANGVKAHAVLKEGTTATLKGEVLNSKVTITATTLSSSSGTIFQEGTLAKDSGILEFSGLSVDEPAGCKVKSPIKTKELTSELVDHAGNEHAYDKFFPETGEVFATVTIEGCAIAGSYNVKGKVYGEANKWATPAAKQPLAFSPAINTTLGGELTLGTKPAELTLEGVNTLESGKSFSADT